MSTTAAISEFDAFRAGLRGGLVLPGDAAYNDARKVWNGMIDKRPAAVVQAEGVSDVIRTVAFARTAGLPLAIRGGGHNVAGNATCNGGIVLDLGAMRSIRVNPVARSVRAEAGALWRQLDHETEAFGLATPGGAVSTTGIAGLTLGGGYGYIARRFGMVCDNLLSVDVVTADGRFLTASASENADLFWGLRGGGGNFGVATSFEYKLHRLPQVYGGPLVFPLEQAARVLERFREVAESAPDELTLLAGVPIPDAGPVMGVVVAYVGPEEEGKRVTKPLRDLGPVMDGAAPTPYTKLQQTFDAAYPKGQRTYWKSAYLKELPNDLISRAVEMAINAPAKSHLVIEQAGGAIARVPAGETAFEHRGAKFNILAVGLGTEPSEDQANIEWARKLWAMAQPHSTGGAYVNYLGEGETVSPAYGSQTYRRLAELKKKYDPGNFFRLNQNIQPGH